MYRLWSILTKNPLVDTLLVDVYTDDIPNFYLIGIGLLTCCISFWIILRFLVRNSISISLSRSLLSHKVKGEKMPFDSKNSIPLQPIHHKFNIAFWQATSYSILFVYGVWVMHQESWIYDYEKYVLPVTFVSWKLALYYHLTISHYLYSTYLLIFVDHRLKDFFQMVIHHMITLFLTMGSYYGISRSHIGVIIMLLHDASDPFLHVAKMAKYAKKDDLANISFGIFAIVFLITRCVLYPFFVVFPLFWVYLGHDATPVKSVPFIGSLILLLALNIYWAALVLKMAIKAIFSGNVEQDIREDD